MNKPASGKKKGIYKKDNDTPGILSKLNRING
jgi:hypothetical protein